MKENKPQSKIYDFDADNGIASLMSDKQIDAFAKGLTQLSMKKKRQSNSKGSGKPSSSPAGRAGSSEAQLEKFLR
jgi:hypothetical protein